MDIALALTSEELQGLGLVKLGDRKRFLALAQSVKQAGEAKEAKTERMDRSMFRRRSVLAPGLS